MTMKRMKNWIVTVFVMVSFLTAGCEEEYKYEFYFTGGDTYTMKVGDELVLECVLNSKYLEIFWLSSTRVAVVERLTPVNWQYPKASDRVESDSV
jgi:hypothetical protein